MTNREWLNQRGLSKILDTISNNIEDCIYNPLKVPETERPDCDDFWNCEECISQWLEQERNEGR